MARDTTIMAKKGLCACFIDGLIGFHMGDDLKNDKIIKIFFKSKSRLNLESGVWSQESGVL
jgi:hypothetical protein